MQGIMFSNLLAARINPKYFILHGLTVVWLDENGVPNDNSIYKTPENLAIVADVIANYETLAAEYTTKQTILKQIDDLEKTQTPRRIRDAINGTDNGWMAALESQIAALRTQL